MLGPSPLRAVGALLSFILLAACGEPDVDGDAGLPRLPDGATGSVEEARAALQRCDVRQAHALYATAWQADRDDGEAALGFALTDAALLGEDPEAEAGLALFGFTGPIDGEDMLFGPGALLDALARHQESRDFGDRMERVFPWDSEAPSTGYAFERMPPGTTAREVVAHGWAMQPRFSRLVDAFEAAAEDAPVTLDIGGICEVGVVELQAPELYALAASFQSLVMTLQIGRGYSWDFPIHEALPDRGDDAATVERQAALLNTHFGAVSDPSALEGARDEMRRFFELVERTVDAADAAGAPGADALVEWRALPSDIVPTGRLDAQAALAGTEEQTSAPGMTPEFRGDFRPLFEGELDLADFGRTFTVHEDPMWGDVWIEVDEAPIDRLLMAVVSPSPLDDTLSDVEWSHLDAWSGADADWQVDDVEVSWSEHRTYSAPRFILPTVERYAEVYYFAP
ncbi:MAG TPA: hypothetical protein RMH99_12880 [Sandaracinaceae bacterium LLY-WYZ-13_1]|nr:hypothetical protein [Sandaracinaceae bacterium LLY-WYZ-13_1]